jgi:alpha-N-arabinofuranosidase
VQTWTSPATWWTLDGNQGQIRIEALPFTLNCRSGLARESRCDQQQPAFLARRQQHRAFDASTRLEQPRSAAVAAGLTTFQSSNFHYFLGVRRHDGAHELFLEQVRDGHATELVRAPLAAGHSHVVLGVEQQGSQLGFYFESGDERAWLKRDADATVLSTQVAGGFVGATLGIHARTANAAPTAIN